MTTSRDARVINGQSPASSHRTHSCALLFLCAPISQSQTLLPPSHNGVGSGCSCSCFSAFPAGKTPREVQKGPGPHVSQDSEGGAESRMHNRGGVSRAVASASNSRVRARGLMRLQIESGWETGRKQIGKGEEQRERAAEFPVKYKWQGLRPLPSSDWEGLKRRSSANFNSKFYQNSNSRYS